MRYLFGECELDTDRHALLRAGNDIHVEPQVFDLLRLLAESPTALVTYDAMIWRVWRERIVSDATLASRVAAARAAVGCDGRRQAVIHPVPRRSVRLALPVRTEGDDASAPDTPPTARQRTIRYARSRDGTAIAYSV